MIIPCLFSHFQEKRGQIYVTKSTWKLSNANCHKNILSYNIIPTDHHLGFQDGGHLEPILINISVQVQDGIEGPKL